MSTPPRVYFRFKRLDKMQAFTLTREVMNARYEPSVNEGTFVGLVPLERAAFEDINNFFVRQQLGYDNCDILVVGCGFDEPVEVTAPAVVNEMLKFLECPITFRWVSSAR